MTKTSAKAATTDRPEGGGKTPPAPANVTLGLAITMAWQLVVVVLVPVLAGHVLDKHFGTDGLWTIIGVVVAMAGMVTVVWQTVKAFNVVIQDTTKNKHDS